MDFLRTIQASSRRTEADLLTHGDLSLSIQDARVVESLVLPSCVWAEDERGPTLDQRSWGIGGGRKLDAEESALERLRGEPATVEK